MKLYKKIALALCVVIATSCTLDLREDPNAVQPSQVLPSLMLNSMQRGLAGLFNGTNGTGSSLTRLINGGSSIYRTTITPETFNGVWSTAYANILNDANTLMQLSVPDKTKPNERYARHMGITRIIQAYTLVSLVDMFGDVPFSQAFKGDGNFNPGVDNSADLYTKALELLDSAKIDLTTPTTTSAPPGYQSPIAPDIFDMYYGNGASSATTTFTKWVRLANSIKLKIYLNLRLTDATAAAAGINALLADNTATGGLIGYTTAHAVNGTGQTENFVFRYGLTTADPDARHPAFVGQYPAGGGDYQSNWLMWHMFHGYDATQGGQPGDPRIRFYFYRQVTANSTSTNEIRCLGESLPSHYPTSTGSAIIDNSIAGRAPMGVAPTNPTNDPTDAAWGRTFCYVSDRGYWGRDHIDPQGIPPDGLLRTAYGPYPVGGRFDANNGAGVSAGVGMRGAGMEPIMMRSFVNFMLAEAALYLPLGGPARTARQYFEEGMRQSFTDVRDWAVNGTYGTTTVAAAPNEAATINSFYASGTYTTDVNNYVASALAAFDASQAGTQPVDLVPGTANDETMNYIAREYWIALFRNGLESYNLYRRTGMPSGMQPVLNPTPGEFPRSYWYPANFANLNNTVEQKADLKPRVFWDNNTTNLDF
ncbi:MAG: SusD/RagB family nutrient-binding outer membrane lipoprotein [Cyclobacteriaceae bacterium]|nr:SusD/RagB family nutrient-binding outer membrane lipoprotein [Cyclobacteriaceae bacterium]